MFKLSPIQEFYYSARKMSQTDFWFRVISSHRESLPEKSSKSDSELVNLLAAMFYNSNDDMIMV
jgi:hypothetical protein